MSETYSGTFSCSKYKQQRSYKDLFVTGKNDPPTSPLPPPLPQGLHRPKISQA